MIWRPTTLLIRTLCQPAYLLFSPRSSSSSFDVSWRCSVPLFVVMFTPPHQKKESLVMRQSVWKGIKCRAIKIAPFLLLLVTQFAVAEEKWEKEQTAEEASKDLAYMKRMPRDSRLCFASSPSPRVWISLIQSISRGWEIAPQRHSNSNIGINGRGSNNYNFKLASNRGGEENLFIQIISTLCGGS